MIVICERCHKKQENRTLSTREAPGYVGCIRCWHPYGRYARP